MEIDDQPPLAASAATGFQNRMDAVFGALGGSSGLSRGWNVSQISVYKPGSLDPADDDDEEEEDAPDGTDQTAAEIARDADSNAMVDEDKEDLEVRKSASLAFCSALDRECEMDDYDSMAMGSYHNPAAGAPEDKSMEVLPGNYYENRCLGKEARKGGAPIVTAGSGGMAGEAPTDGDKFLADEVQRCKEAEMSGSVRHRGGDPIRWSSSRSTDPEGLPQASYAGSGSRIQWPSRTFLAAEEREKESRSAQNPPEGSNAVPDPSEGAAAPVRRGGEPILWPKASTGTAAAAEGGGASVPRQGKEKRHKSVRFAEPEKPPQGRSDGERTGRPLPPRSAMRRGRGHRKVPDHVLNPHKWTCYTLDEPLTIGGGGGGDTASGWLKDRNANVVEDHAGHSSHGDGRRVAVASERGQQPDEVMMEDCVVEEAQPPLPLPGQAGLKFIPRKDRVTTSGTGKQSGKQGAGTSADGWGKQQKGRGVATGQTATMAIDDIDVDCEEEYSAMDIEAAKGASKPRRRQFRSKK